METIRAVYENGIFRPIGPIDLPDQSVVEFEPRPVNDDRREQARDAIYAVLSHRHRSGRHDLADRHNEHQP